MDLRTVYERLGDKENYEDAVRNELEVYPRYLARYPEDPRAHIFYAVALARAGRNKEGKREAAKATELNPSDPLMLYNTACFYAKIGEKRLALDSLKNSILAGFEYYEWIRHDPDLDSIRNEPEYIALIEKKGQSSK
jgi:Flp pilus assembly protein TadD